MPHLPRTNGTLTWADRALGIRASDTFNSRHRLDFDVSFNDVIVAIEADVASHRARAMHASITAKLLWLEAEHLKGARDLLATACGNLNVLYEQYATATAELMDCCDSADGQDAPLPCATCSASRVTERHRAECAALAEAKRRAAIEAFANQLYAREQAALLQQRFAKKMGEAMRKYQVIVNDAATEFAAIVQSMRETAPAGAIEGMPVLKPSKKARKQAAAEAAWAQTTLGITSHAAAVAPTTVNGIDMNDDAAMEAGLAARGICTCLDGMCCPLCAPDDELLDEAAPEASQVAPPPPAPAPTKPVPVTAAAAAPNRTKVATPPQRRSPVTPTQRTRVSPNTTQKNRASPVVATGLAATATYRLLANAAPVPTIPRPAGCTGGKLLTAQELQEKLHGRYNDSSLPLACPYCHSRAHFTDFLPPTGQEHLAWCKRCDTKGPKPMFVDEWTPNAHASMMGVVRPSRPLDHVQETEHYGGLTKATLSDVATAAKRAPAAPTSGKAVASALPPAPKKSAPAPQATPTINKAVVNPTPAAPATHVPPPAAPTSTKAPNQPTWGDRLLAMTPAQQREMLGERLYPAVLRITNDDALARRVTGVMLDSDVYRLIDLFASETRLVAEIREVWAFTAARTPKQDATDATAPPQADQQVPDDAPAPSATDDCGVCEFPMHSCVCNAPAAPPAVPTTTTKATTTTTTVPCGDEWLMLPLNSKITARCCPAEAGSKGDETKWARDWVNIVYRGTLRGLAEFEKHRRATFDEFWDTETSSWCPITVQHHRYNWPVTIPLHTEGKYECRFVDVKLVVVEPPAAATPAPATVLRGYATKNNCCFAAASLMALRHVLVDFSYLETVDDSVAAALKEAFLFKGHLHTRQLALKHMQKYFDGRQHDAVEFIGELLNLLDDGEASPYLNSVLATCTATTVTQGGEVSTLFDPCTPTGAEWRRPTILCVPIWGFQTVQMAVDRFWTTPAVQGSNATMESRLTCAPEYLVIALKRFDTRGGKITQEVKCDEDLYVPVNSEQFHYELTALVHHHGSTPIQGHYVTVARDLSCPHLWTQYDGEKRQACQLTAVVAPSDTSYVAFFRRKEESPVARPPPRGRSEPRVARPIAKCHRPTQPGDRIAHELVSTKHTTVHLCVAKTERKSRAVSVRATTRHNDLTTSRNSQVMAAATAVAESTDTVDAELAAATVNAESTAATAAAESAADTVDAESTAAAPITAVPEDAPTVAMSPTQTATPQPRRRSASCKRQRNDGAARTEVQVKVLLPDGASHMYTVTEEAPCVDGLQLWLEKKLGGEEGCLSADARFTLNGKPVSGATNLLLEANPQDVVQLLGKLRGGRSGQAALLPVVAAASEGVCRPGAEDVVATLGVTMWSKAVEILQALAPHPWLPDGKLPLQATAERLRALNGITGMPAALDEYRRARPQPRLPAAPPFAPGRAVIDTTGVVYFVERLDPPWATVVCAGSPTKHRVPAASLRMLPRVGTILTDATDYEGDTVMLPFAAPRSASALRSLPQCANVMFDDDDDDSGDEGDDDDAATPLARHDHPPQPEP
jgi:hypothetical protein